ncbi:MAG TPA: class I SAM-dependent methyltransferase [Anaerolineales bacterium]
MESTDYEYRGLMATYWDLLRGDTSHWADRFFYKDMILVSGEPVMDVGCGTGRLLLDYLAEGIDIDGVDNSPEMLAICREKAGQRGLNPALYLKEMASLDLPRKYRTILVPSSSFQLLVEPDAAEAALKRFFDHLEPGGMLVMSLMILWTGPAEEEIVREDWSVVAEKTRPEDGALVRRWARSTYDLRQQLEHTEDRYELVKDGEVVASEDHARSPATRWYTQEQAIALYKRAGFTGVRLNKEFTHEPASPEDTLFTIRGIRP